MVDTVCSLNWRWLHQLLSLEAYKHPITGKNLAGPDAEKGPVEIDEDAYQDAIGRFHDFI